MEREERTVPGNWEGLDERCDLWWRKAAISCGLCLQEGGSWEKKWSDPTLFPPSSLLRPCLFAALNCPASVQNITVLVRHNSDPILTLSHVVQIQQYVVESCWANPSLWFTHKEAERKHVLFKETQLVIHQVGWSEELRRPYSKLRCCWIYSKQVRTKGWGWKES